MQFSNQEFTFESHSPAASADSFLVVTMVGEEEMSGLFRFELELVSTETELDLEAVLYAPATLGIKVSLDVPGTGKSSAMREISGVLAEFEQQEVGQGFVKYRAVFVPSLWLLTRSFRSRIFQDKPVCAPNADNLASIVEEVLGDYGLEKSSDFDFQLTPPPPDEKEEADPKAAYHVANYPRREYVVQYEESDWDFLKRWLEHEGIFFFFTNQNGREKVVFADSKVACVPSLFGSSFAYKPGSTGEGAEADQLGEEEVQSLVCRQSRLPELVSLNDYNWRAPSVRMHHSEQVHANGTGRQSEYNDHFKTTGQGKALARVRKEELTSRARVFSGHSSCRSFRPGHTFELTGHYRSDFNRGYLLAKVRHEGEQMVSIESAKVTGVKYTNTFEAVPDDKVLRPERVTPWPSIKGVMNAKIDAAGDGEYAELDEYGRYKLIFPFDEAPYDPDEPRPAGMASRWVRMAQPYAGVDSGMHFPLLKGTEVLVAHVDGDPDRPVITGAVPNAEMESPTTGANPSANTIKTASGNRLEFDDDQGASGYYFRDASASLVQDFRNRLGGQRSGSKGGASQGAGTGGAPGAEPPSFAFTFDAEPGGSPRAGAEVTFRAGGPARKSPELPDIGSGMPTNQSIGASKQQGPNSIHDAWVEFVTGDALEEVGEVSRFVEEFDDASTADVDESENNDPLTFSGTHTFEDAELSGPSVTPDFHKGGLDEALHNLFMLVHKIKTGTSSSGTTTPAGNVVYDFQDTDIFSDRQSVYDFLGAASNVDATTIAANAAAVDAARESREKYEAEVAANQDNYDNDQPFVFSESTEPASYGTALGEMQQAHSDLLAAQERLANAAPADRAEAADALGTEDGSDPNGPGLGGAPGGGGAGTTPATPGGSSRQGSLGHGSGAPPSPTEARMKLGPNAGQRTAWAHYLKKREEYLVEATAALQDLKSALGTVDGSDPLQQPGAPDPNPHTVQFNGALTHWANYLDAVETYKSSLGSLGDAMGKLNNFTGNAYGSRLMAYLGDSVWVKSGNSYTYADVSNDISISAGDGYAYKWSQGSSWTVSHTRGDDHSHSRTYGNTSSNSKTDGNDSSWSVTEGATSSHSEFYGSQSSYSMNAAAKASASFTFDASADFSFVLAARTDNEVKLGIYNSNGLQVGAWFGLTIYCALKAELEVGKVWKFDLDKTNVVIRKNGVWVSSDDIAVKKFRASLKDSFAAIDKQQAALNKYNAAVKEAEAAVARDEMSVQEKRAALNAAELAFAKDNAALAANNKFASETTVAMAKSFTGALNKVTAGAQIM